MQILHEFLNLMLAMLFIDRTVSTTGEMEPWALRSWRDRGRP